MRKLDLKGKRFGKWTVLSATRVEGRRTLWICKCDCGTEAVVHACNLRSGGSTKCEECGFGEPSVKVRSRVLQAYQKSAKDREIYFGLSIEDFSNLCSGDCHYCGAKPSKIVRTQSGRGLWVRNGIDRVNSDIGYVLENCVSCCYTCNIMKRDRSYSDFVDHIHKISEHLKSCPIPPNSTTPA